MIILCLYLCCSSLLSLLFSEITCQCVPYCDVFLFSDEVGVAVGDAALFVCFSKLPIHVSAGNIKCFTCVAVNDPQAAIFNQ